MLEKLIVVLVGLLSACGPDLILFPSQYLVELVGFRTPLGAYMKQLVPPLGVVTSPLPVGQDLDPSFPLSDVVSGSGHVWMDKITCINEQLPVFLTCVRGS